MFNPYAYTAQNTMGSGLYGLDQTYNTTMGVGDAGPINMQNQMPAAGAASPSIPWAGLLQMAAKQMDDGGQQGLLSEPMPVRAPQEVPSALEIWRKYNMPGAK